MQTFRLRPDGFTEIRKKILLRSIPTIVLALTFGVVVTTFGNKTAPTDISSFTPMFGIMPLLIGIGIYMGLKKQKALLESYVLTISDNLICREQLNTPNISIYATEVIEIVQYPKKGFSIKGNRNNGVIYIPAQIDNYSQLEATLQQIHPITTKTSLSFLQKFQNLLTFGALGLMLCVYIVNNKLVVGIAGCLLTALMTWSMVKIQTDKNIDQKTKNKSWWLVLVLASIIVTTIVKVITPTSTMP